MSALLKRSLLLENPETFHNDSLGIGKKNTGVPIMAVNKNIMMKMTELLLGEQLISLEEKMELTNLIQKGLLKDD